MARGVDSGKVEVWRERMVRFANWGGTIGAFCAGEGVSVPSFYDWRRRLRGIDASAASDENSPSVAHEFAAIRVAESGAASGRVISATLPGGTRIEIPADDERLLSTVLRALVVAEGIAAENAGARRC